jgi:hypothetical protein
LASIPKAVEEELHFDKENGNNLWWNAMCKEMRYVRLAFEKWERSTSALPQGLQERIKCDMIFDIKMGENFRRKARLLAT